MQNRWWATIFRSGALLLGLIWTAISGFAQAGKAELFGVVEDPSGLPLSGAKVQAEEQETRTVFQANTDGRGEYHLLVCPLGNTQSA